MEWKDYDWLDITGDILVCLCICVIIFVGLLF